MLGQEPSNCLLLCGRHITHLLIIVDCVEEEGERRGKPYRERGSFKRESSQYIESALINSRVGEDIRLNEILSV